MMANMTQQEPLSPESPQVPGSNGNTPMTESETPQPRKSKKPLIIGLSIVAGLVIVGAAVTIPLVMIANENEAREQAAAEAEEARRNEIPEAVRICGIDEGSYSVLDDGDAIEFKRALKFLEPDSASAVDVFCVLNLLDAPESIETKIEQTRSLDGTRETAWDGWTAQWTYHPKAGLNMLIERSTS